MLKKRNGTPRKSQIPILFIGSRIYIVSRALELKDIFSHRAEGTEPFRKLFSSDLQGTVISKKEPVRWKM